MKTSVFLVVVVSGALLAAGWSLRGGAAAATRQPSAVVVAKLPEIGTVYERTYCTGTGHFAWLSGTAISRWANPERSGSALADSAETAKCSRATPPRGSLRGAATPCGLLRQRAVRTESSWAGCT